LLEKDKIICLFKTLGYQIVVFAKLLTILFIDQ